VRAGVAGVLAAGGRIDALVASAGWGLAGAVEQCTIGEAKAQLETNFWGCVRVLQQVLPAMRAQGGGRIVLMSSIGERRACRRRGRRGAASAGIPPPAPAGFRRQAQRASGFAGQAAAAVPRLRGRGEEQPGNLTITPALGPDLPSIQHLFNDATLPAPAVSRVMLGAGYATSFALT
jgi:short chain dehydrogenase